MGLPEPHAAEEDDIFWVVLPQMIYVVLLIPAPHGPVAVSFGCHSGLSLLLIQLAFPLSGPLIMNTLPLHYPPPM
jgi:hypothetical protein